MVEVYCTCGGKLKFNHFDKCYDCLGKCKGKYKLEVSIIPLLKDKPQQALLE